METSNSLKKKQPLIMALIPNKHTLAFMTVPPIHNSWLQFWGLEGDWHPIIFQWQQNCVRKAASFYTCEGYVVLYFTINHSSSNFEILRLSFYLYCAYDKRLCLIVELSHSDSPPWREQCHEQSTSQFLDYVNVHVQHMQAIWGKLEACGTLPYSYGR